MQLSHTTRTLGTISLVRHSCSFFVMRGRGCLGLTDKNIYFGVSKSAPTPRYTILDSRLTPCNVISESRPPLSNTSSQAGALPLEVRIENDSDRKKISKFLWKPLFYTFHAILFILSRKYFFGVRTNLQISDIIIM